MANPLEQGPVRYDDAFERFDAKVARVEAAVMTFALLAMSASYFLKIVFEAVVAERNFIDAFLLRWMHGTDSTPPAELLTYVHGTLTPIIVVVGLLCAGVAAARTATLQRARNAGAPAPGWNAMSAVAGIAIALGLAAIGVLVMVVPSRWVSLGLYAAGLGLFAGRARRMGDLGAYVALWVPLSIPIVALLWVIPAQYAWVNDLAKVLIMYVGFLGASMASREQKHILLNFGRKLWPASMKRGFEAMSLSIWLGFDLLLLALAWHLFSMHLNAGSTLSILPIGESHISLPVVISLVIMATRVAADLVRVLRGQTPVAPTPAPEQPTALAAAAAGAQEAA